MVSRRNKVSARLARGVSEAESKLELELELELVDVHDAYSAGAAEMTSAGASSAGGAASGLPRNLKKPAKP